jgi:hypothetical protein
MIPALANAPGRCANGFDFSTQHGPKGLCDCEQGQARKHRLLAAVNDAAPADVKAEIDAVILQLASTGQPFSANDCRPRFPDVKGAVIGGRFNALGKAGLIRKTGDRVPSSLGNTNGHEIHVWSAA